MVSVSKGHTKALKALMARIYQTQYTRSSSIYSAVPLERTFYMASARYRHRSASAANSAFNTGALHSAAARS